MKKRNKKLNLKKMKYDHKKITLEPLMLGSIVMKYELPKRLIDDINSAYDQAKDLPSWNQHLAGKIEEEKYIFIMRRVLRIWMTRLFRPM